MTRLRKHSTINSGLRPLETSDVDDESNPPKAFHDKPRTPFAFLLTNFRLRFGGAFCVLYYI